MITNLPGDDPRDLILDAVWDKKYNITFVTGTEESISAISTTTSKEVVISAPKERKGYTFEHWSDGKGNTIQDKIPANMYESNITLTAVWKPIVYHVTFTDGGETKDTKEYTIESGLSEFPTIRKDGYVFNSWLDESSQSISSISKGTVGNKTFTADWTEITYKLTYDYADGKTAPVTDTYKYTQASQTQLRSASWKGYNFLGWFLSGSSTKLEKVPVTLSDTQKEFSFTATAKWEAQNYKVIFYLNDGTGAALSEKEYTYNVSTGISAENMPKDIKRTGYNFEGWYKNDACTGDKIGSISAGIGELKLYAKWTPKTYKIIYNMQGGTNATDAPSSFVYDKGRILPSENVKRDHYTFAGWTVEATSTTYIKSIPANTECDQTFYAQWTPKVYTISYVTNTETTLPDQSYLYGTEVKTKKIYKDGYTLIWCYDVALTQPLGDKITADKIPAGTGDELVLYAKWTPTEYMITYDTYYGKITSGKVEKYTIEQEVPLLEDVRRDGFSFAGWYADDLLTTKVTKIEKGSSGNKTFYATWDRGYQLIFTQPSYGKISVTRNGSALSAGTMIGKGESLTVTAEATNVNYELKQLVINDKVYPSSPQLIEMPEKDLKITAVFAEASSPAASAPEIILTPSGVDKFPKGEDVKVQLKKTDEATTLYYRLDGSPERAYLGEFRVESAQDTVLLEAIARKEGLRDGVAARYIIFDNGKITLTFDLPLGVKATNPTGGDVVTATTTGGSFEFKLTVDQNYYTNLDSMVVAVNDSTITAGASGLYTLTNCSSDVTVTVSGLKARTCTVTLQQTENGQIKFTDGAEETTSEVGYGSTVSITAVADEDFKFLQWNTGSQSNPLNLTVSRDTTISTRFISDYKSYMMTLPQVEGVTVKPFSDYATEVKKDGTFKFYLVLSKGYHEENLMVRANGEELAKNKGGYAIYHINKNISISVDGIVRDSMKLTLPDHVTAKVVETMSDAVGQGIFEETLLLLQANAPEGKVFTKWNDGKTDNPRTATAVDAAQLIPLFVDKEDITYAKVTLHQSVGAAITGANSNMDAVKSGDIVQLKVVLLPAYSRSEVVLTADDKVLTPETSLRAASETKTYVYNLPVEKDGITVKVSGLKLNDYEVAVTQTNGGTVSAVPAGKVAHGDKVQLKAEAASGMLFIKWWDGNTLNPCPYTVTSDTEVKAYFLGAESTVDNESIRKEEKGQISVTGRGLSVTVTEKSELYIWDYKGSLFRNQTIPAGEYTCSLPSGAYLVKVGDGQPVKVVVR
ncbi:MAG: InlB B-repeat-containing protein [Parabacteroides gordonii]|nr:InlB B-repeat-containing protein [Parabacteroides gordonii]